MSLSKEALLEAHRRGYWVNDQGEVFKPDGSPQKTRLKKEFAEYCQTNRLLTFSKIWQKE